MARSNKRAEIMKILERMQTRMEESEKKIEMMATAHQNLTTEPQRDDGEKLHDEEQEANGKGEPNNRKKEDEGEKGTYQVIH